MDLTHYLNRIGYAGPLTPSLETLRALHRAHLHAIPYENLDIHLGRALTLDVAHIFDKLVTQRRGGWCFEMNGLFAWALSELGFSVELLGGAVNREHNGDKTLLTHLVLLVELEGHYLADVGFGNGFLEPLPLEAGPYRQGFLDYRLKRLDEDWWRYRHHHGGPSFDFTLEPYKLADFAAQCHALQTSPESPFVRLTVCHRFTPAGIVSLRGALLSHLSHEGVSEQTLDNPAVYKRVLGERFGLQLESAAALWARVWQTHLAWLEAQH